MENHLIVTFPVKLVVVFLESVLEIFQVIVGEAVDELVRFLREIDEVVADLV
jgi:hypothetical protein